jgi:ribonuclease BN (tRNA processing enzyme)/polynucleotide 5'-kinase involved in rRNA processing
MPERSSPAATNLRLRGKVKAVTTEETAQTIARALEESAGAAIFLGRPGRGKSTLVARTVALLEEHGAKPSLLAADPGQPTIGPPAALALSLPRMVAFIGSTDPMAVRLTALGELHRLVQRFRAERRAPLVIDACGLVANAVGREWAIRQVEATGATHAVLVEREQELEPLARLLARRVTLVRTTPHPEAHSLNTRERRSVRGKRLEEWLKDSEERVLPLDLPLVGAPERGVLAGDWEGRLVGLLDAHGATLAIGHALAADDETLRVRVAPAGANPHALRVGDAVWDKKKKTVERRVFAEAPLPPPSGVFAIRAKPVFEVEPFAVAGDERSKRAPGFQVHLPNGIFGDPLVHLRPLRERDGILLDLGRASSLPVKLLHRIGLVLLSHAHMDHFFGFDELLRALLGTPRSLTIVGPEGAAARVASRVDGYSWNLIEADAEAHVGAQPPRFTVIELRGEKLRETEIVPGSAPRLLGERPAPRGLVHEAERFTVRAAPLEHRDITSLSYLIEEKPRLAVRPEALREKGLAPGPWLDALKHAFAEKKDADLELGDGRRARVSELAPELLVERPGQRIVYVTDAADSPRNRQAISELAKDVDLLICEATFTRPDEDRARETAHLPAFAAAELAREARVGRLLPFHLSPRYEETPELIFQELLSIFPRVQVPRELLNRIAPAERDL